jgi:hypothetical protein
MNSDNQTTTATAEANPFAEAAAQEAAKPRQPSILDQVTVRKRKRPVFGVLVGPHGVGKSTFGATLPKPIVIATERIDQIHVPKLPVPRTFTELYRQIDALDKEAHDYESIVLDSVDAADLLVVQRVCQEGKCKSIEEFGGGWQKGYTRGRELWTGLLTQLRDMSERFNVLLIAGAHVKSFTDPLLSVPYDRWTLKLQERSAELIRQMCDLIMFVNIETAIEKDSAKAKKGRGIVTDDRLLWTAPTTGFEAKNRFNLESPLEFKWSVLQEGIDRYYNQ